MHGECGSSTSLAPFATNSQACPQEQCCRNCIADTAIERFATSPKTFELFAKMRGGASWRRPNASCMAARRSVTKGEWLQGGLNTILSDACTGGWLDDRDRTAMPDLPRQDVRTRPEGTHGAEWRHAPLPGCQSLERHRISRIMFENLGRENFAGWSAIQFSADPTVDPAWFGSFELSVYGASGGLDIQAIDRPDCDYDYVGCSHVLEHVGDDRAALRELLRITAPDGLVYLAFPDPFREDVTRDWGFPKPENTAIGASMVATSRSASKPTIPLQPVLAYRVRIRLPASGRCVPAAPINRAPSLDRQPSWVGRRAFFRSALGRHARLAGFLIGRKGPL